ncbi:MAG: hypothetical protein HQL05_15955 [Nitrospirae bacterium]|uniref:hypothetical protein n=1 Tax=Candidatus Magnetobacterium casense TaxID=1455061 RepID=UPI000590303E|nr:hypothetical protein [Candidatus Magnetobacterium casensis]MBF0339314.1 hypothetical protein [Nitrospirota bacterium]
MKANYRSRNNKTGKKTLILLIAVFQLLLLLTSAYAIPTWVDSTSGTIDDQKGIANINDLVEPRINAYQCTQGVWGNQCVSYVRGYFAGSGVSMPGLGENGGAYLAWSNWNSNYGKDDTPTNNSIDGS